MRSRRRGRLTKVILRSIRRLRAWLLYRVACMLMCRYNRSRGSRGRRGLYLILAIGIGRRRRWLMAWWWARRIWVDERVLLEGGPIFRRCDRSL